MQLNLCFYFVSIFSLQLNESYNTRIQFSPSNQICLSHGRHLWKLVSMTDKNKIQTKSQNFGLIPSSKIPSSFSQKFELVSETFNLEMMTLNFDLWIEKNPCFFQQWMQTSMGSS